MKTAILKDGSILKISQLKKITGLGYHAALRRIERHNDGDINQEQLLAPKNSSLIRVYQSRQISTKSKMQWYNYQQYQAKYA